MTVYRIVRKFDTLRSVLDLWQERNKGDKKNASSLENISNAKSVVVETPLKISKAGFK